MFYGSATAAIHHAGFGFVAEDATALVSSLLHDAGVTSGTVVDLGCGTGIFARGMIDAGFDVVGFDYSAQMLDIAKRAAPAARLMQASLYDAELVPCVAVTCMGEPLNYDADIRVGLDALAALASRVFDVLEPGGVFVFDVSTPGRGGPTGTRETWRTGPDWAIHMTAVEDTARRHLHRHLTMFTSPDGGATYRRLEEDHGLHLFDAGEVRGVLAAAGFDVEVRESYTSEPATFPGWAVFVSRKPVPPPG